MLNKDNDPFRILEEAEEKESHLIESLEKKLYSRQDLIEEKERTVLKPKKFGHAEGWENQSLEYKKSSETEGGSPFVKFFLFSIVFFLIAAGIAGYSLFSKRIVYSPENVTLSLFGPVSIKGGEDLSVQISVENKNTVGLNKIELTTDFPEGSRSLNEPEKTLTRTVKKLEDMNAGEVRTETIKMLLLGKENDKKEIIIGVRFSIEGSNAVYTKTKKFKVSLTTPPLSFTTTVLKEVTSGHDFSFEVDVKSNSPTTIKGSIFKVDYPKGFVFKGADPAPSFGDNIWALGDLSFADKKHIEIVGSLLGEADQEKIFHLSAGMGTPKDKYSVATLFGTKETGVTIKKPFLGVAIFVNGSNTEAPVVDGWGNIGIGVQWTNSLRNKVVDAEIEVTIIGDTINKRTISVSQQGVYNSVKNSFYWDKRADPNLSSVPPGGKGLVNFNFSLLPYTSTQIFKNPEITVTTSVKGKRIDENNVPEEIKFFSTKTIKLSGQPDFVSCAVYKSDNLANEGPIPPRVGQKTTYTIIWKAKNTANNISDAEISASIPLGVEYTGKVFPSGAPLLYDQTSHKVTWKIGSMKAGKGYVNDPEEVSFQVALSPVFSHLGQEPLLLSGSVFTSVDDFTNTKFTISANAISTNISDWDPSVESDDARVVE